MLGKIEGRRGRGQKGMRWLGGITASMNVSLSKAPGDSEGRGSRVRCRPWGHKESDATERLNHINIYYHSLKIFDFSVLRKKNGAEESSFLTSGYTTKLRSSRQYGTGTKTEIQTNGTR